MTTGRINQVTILIPTAGTVRRRGRSPRPQRAGDRLVVLIERGAGLDPQLDRGRKPERAVRKGIRLPSLISFTAGPPQDHRERVGGGAVACRSQEGYPQERSRLRDGYQTGSDPK